MRRQSEDWEAESPGPNLGQRLARFIASLGIVFAITAAVVITRRLSQDSLALLIGLSCGIMAMLPAVLLGFIVWRREDAHRREQAQQQQMQQPFGYAGSPPVIVVAPQAMPTDYRAAFGPPNPGSTWASQQNQRTFMIVGDEE